MDTPPSVPIALTSRLLEAPLSASRSKSAGAARGQRRTLTFCRGSCGRAPAPGLTKRGNPFDTCCKSCLGSRGIAHDSGCSGGNEDGEGGPKALSAAPQRAVCPASSRCKRRDAAHLDEMSHPLDPDYAQACAASKVAMEPLSLLAFFQWADVDGSGKLSPAELQSLVPRLEAACGENLKGVNWSRLDEDGNGVVNFSEFAAWAGPRLGLPLGLERFAASGAPGSTPCGVLNCPCGEFIPKPRTACDGPSPLDLCASCKHTRERHAKTDFAMVRIPVPGYWQTPAGELSGNSNVLYQTDDRFVAAVQRFVDKTTLKVWTRDRARHNPLCPDVPNAYDVVKVIRNENFRAWTKYCCRMESVRAKVENEAVDLVRGVKSQVAWGEEVACSRLAKNLNEWYLFHGTGVDVAREICKADFRVSCAGSNTGTLYGKGLYFAESFTKADEYAKPTPNGNYTMLVCRVLGGRVRYTDEVEPDPEDLVQSCVSGPYDTVLGDRAKCKGTFREFVIFDSEDVYTEYIIEYERLW